MVRNCSSVAMNYKCSELLVAAFYIFCISTSNIGFGDAQKPFNVLNFGAVGDGKADDSPAFTRAWGALCGASGGTLTLAVPAGHTFLLKPVKFEGPCKSNSVHIQVEGSIAAPSTVAAWGGCGILCWLCFSNVNGLVLDGSGQIDGGSGHARRITFEQITLNEAGNPIIIDQHYCDGKKEGCPDQVR
ncbi:polygalacturonase [Salix suchowensis]|nr:polygalacturonase [Salix suchowensis]